MSTPDQTSPCVQVGASDPLEESYCHYVANGSLPEFLSGPARHPVSARMPVTAALPVGTHLSVPIRFADGSVYGTFCCFGHHVDPTLDSRDLAALRLAAGMVTDELEALDAAEADAHRRRDRIADIVATREPLSMVFQPLLDLATGELAGVEALARFPKTGQGPQELFAEAWAVGLGVELEVKAVQTAVASFDSIPNGVLLGVNAAPPTLMSYLFYDAVRGVDGNRLVVEVTEHAAVDDDRALTAATERLRSLGIQLAIDDVGMGFSGLHHIIECAPDAIKIDAAVVRGVHTSPAKAAMIEALASFGRSVGIVVIAEGIETADELNALQRLDVRIGQGYLLGRPNHLEQLVK